MSVAIENGFEFWQQETQASREGLTNGVPYNALIPLIGIYTVLGARRVELTSYDWRQSVLRSTHAMAGLSRSLCGWVDDLEDTMQVPIEPPGQYTSWQAKHIDASIHDGLPIEQAALPWNEEFLARHLGLAIHDDSVRIAPLRIIDGGWTSLRNFYPLTAQLIQEHT